MEEESNKTEKATPHKLREAKKNGQVAKSVETNHAIIQLIFILVGAVFWTSIADGFSDFVSITWLSGYQVIFEGEALLTWFSYIIIELFLIFGPLLIIIMLSGVAANIIQTGFILSTESLKVDINRLNPVTGIKKIFSLLKIFELLKSTLKLVLIGTLLYFGYKKILPELLVAHIKNAAFLDNFIINKLMLVGLSVIFVFIPIVILDVIFSRREFLNKMKMSKRELKEETKKHEGNPEIKSKRRQIQKELAKKSAAISNIPKADLIIVNPMHYAVGLKYDRDTMHAPIIVVKGRGELAKNIRQLAQRYGKIFFRRPKVARNLYKACQIDQAIPPEDFDQVAKIYREFYKIKGLC